MARRTGSWLSTKNLPRPPFSLTRFNEERLPQYRIDHEVPVALSGQAQTRQIKTAESAMGWRVERRSAPLSGELSRVLAGKHLLLRYYDTDGQSHDVTFSLDGAERAYKLASELQQ